MSESEKVVTIRKLLADPFAGHGLTEKESEAARLIALGLSREEAAMFLKISEPALYARLKGVCRKLKIENSKQLTKELFKRLTAILSNSSEKK